MRFPAASLMVAVLLIAGCASCPPASFAAEPAAAGVGVSPVLPVPIPQVQPVIKTVPMPTARAGRVKARTRDEGPTLALPTDVKGDVGQFIKVTATTNGKEVRWFAATPGLNVFPAEMLKDSRTTIVVAQTPGSYTILAYTALGDLPSEPTTTTVQVGPPQPGPTPPPGPGPGPTPPPVDVPSLELQALVAPLKAIMAQADPTKRAAWAGVWADFLATLKTSPPLASNADYRSAIVAFGNAAASRAGLAGAFPGWSAALEAALAARFGVADGAIDHARAVEFIAALAWACQ